MSDDTLVYEIGDVETLSNGSLPPSFSPTSPQTPRAAAQASYGVEPSGRLDLAGSLSLFVPGAGRMLRGDEQGNPLEEIAQASRFAFRRVELRGKWYRQDGGALLGFLREQGAPVAILPASSSSPALEKLMIPWA